MCARAAKINFKLIFFLKKKSEQKFFNFYLLFKYAVYSVDNAYMDEKEEAILALKLLAEYTG